MLDSRVWGAHPLAPPRTSGDGKEIVIARAGAPLAKLVPYRHVEQRMAGVVTARVVLERLELPPGCL